MFILIFSLRYLKLQLTRKSFSSSFCLSTRDLLDFTYHHLTSVLLPTLVKLSKIIKKMWRIIRAVFPTNESLIRVIFFFHFILLAAHWIIYEKANLSIVFYNVIFFLSLFWTLTTRHKASLAKLAALIDFASIGLDLLFFYFVILRGRNLKFEHDLIPFYLNTIFRIKSTLALCAVGSDYAKRELLLAQRKTELQNAELGMELNDANNNNTNNNRYVEFNEDSIETVGQHSRNLLDKVTEV